MLRYQRYHQVGCRAGNSCKKCPYWIEGRHEGRRWHQSLKTTDAKTAAQLVQRAILTGNIDVPAQPDSGITITDAITKFYAEQHSRDSGRTTIHQRRVDLENRSTATGLTLSTARFPAPSAALHGRWEMHLLGRSSFERPSSAPCARSDRRGCELSRSSILPVSRQPTNFS